MEANELRIGNYATEKGRTVEIVGMFGDKVHCKYADGFIGSMLLKYIEPIPLTEEILLKCGFVKHNLLGYSEHFSYQKYIKGETITLNALYNSDFSILLHSVARKIDSLHRLQNIIFALTGEELEINL